MIRASCACAAPSHRPSASNPPGCAARRKPPARDDTNEPRMRDMTLPPVVDGRTSGLAAQIRARRGGPARSSLIELSAFLKMTIRLLLRRVNGINRKPSASTSSRRRWSRRAPVVPGDLGVSGLLVKGASFPGRTMRHLEISRRRRWKGSWKPCAECLRAMPPVLIYAPSRSAPECRLPERDFL